MILLSFLSYVGWGFLDFQTHSASVLHQLALTVQNKTLCTKMNSKHNSITDQMLCAANTDVLKNQSGCHGDSGGPFVCKNLNSGLWVLHGAVSWGSPRCDIKDAFTIFVRIGQFKDWIDQKLKQ